MRTHNSPRLILPAMWIWLILLFSGWSPSHGAISGRLVGKDGIAIAGVTVSLDVQGQSTTTDAQGHFTLGTVSTFPRSGGTGNQARISNRLTFRPGLTPTPLAEGAINMQGRRQAGIDLVPMANGKRQPLSKTASGADTLLFTKSGYLAKRLALAGSDSAIGDVVIYPVFAGKSEKYLGFDLFRFTVAGKNGLVVVPKKVRAGNPWIWRTYFWDHKPLFDSIMCANGYYLAFIDAPNLFGAPTAVTLMDSLYARVTVDHGFSKKTNLLGISRGGLYLYNWARANLDKVSTIYGDGSVMDFVSWPCGCYGTGAGSSTDWTMLKKVYGFSSNAEAKAYTGNPYQNMRLFAEAKIPIIHVYGETDNVAPPAENVLRANDSLKAHGWQMKLLPKPNTGHVHGLTAADGGLPGQLDTLVQFVLRNTTY